jgi:hypothetical protein
LRLRLRLRGMLDKWTRRRGDGETRRVKSEE